jgi:hypothetical protein
MQKKTFFHLLVAITEVVVVLRVSIAVVVIVVCESKQIIIQ